ncbi:hypothetical protein QQY24_02435 [Streptomyces sp. TG1A-8]|uniref:hypothetical protein n=1 Tax=Streptomyces sp. TG1A-8 TaxID=3051385 RepID=UPI00265BE68C|nr:hypothetical protein [Streptomyces sp. TG1A-8]MDO0924322.1 hypothetical protein [Streptomyces sp. TG1A-8]
MSETTQEGAGRLKQTGETARTEASTTAGQAKQAANQVAGTAAEQARTVVGEARQQAGTVIDELRGRVMDEAEGQARRASGALRQWSQDMTDLADNAPGDSSARNLAAQAADRGHRAADYLERQGVDGVVSDIRDFARRRPGAFLGGALLAGVAVGRLAKAAGRAKQSSEPERRTAGGGRFETQDEPLTTPAPPAGAVPQAPPMPPVPPGPVPPAEPSVSPQAPPLPVDPPPPTGTPVRPYPEV